MEIVSNIKRVKMKVLCLVIGAAINFCAAESNNNDTSCSTTGSTDNDGSVKRPCPNFDVACIRPILSKRLRAIPVYGKRSGEYTYNNIPLFVPHAKTTIVWEQSTAFGFDDFEIEDFYINETSNTMVMETILKSIRVESPKTCLYFLMKGKEPERRCDEVKITYRNISLTMTIYDQETSNEIYVFPYLLDASPSLSFGDNIRPTGGVAMNSFNILLEKLPLTYQENFVSQGPIFMYYLMRTAFCRIPLERLRY